jgi:hypothetical protein
VILLVAEYMHIHIWPFLEICSASVASLIERVFKTTACKNVFAFLVPLSFVDYFFHFLFGVFPLMALIETEKG